MGRRVLEMQLPGKRDQGRSKRRYFYAVKEIAARRVRTIRCGDHQVMGQPKEEVTFLIRLGDSSTNCDSAADHKV